MISTWAAVVGGVITAVIFFGAVVVYFRGSSDQGTIATLERSNKALAERVLVLEGENARSIIERDQLVARVEALEHENSALQAVRPSADAIAALTTALARHDADAKAMLSALMLKEIGE